MNTHHTWVDTPAQFTGELTLTMHTHSVHCNTDRYTMYVYCLHMPPKTHCMSRHICLCVLIHVHYTHTPDMNTFCFCKHTIPHHNGLMHICAHMLYSSKQGLVDYLQALPFCILSQRSLRNHCGSLIWHWALDSMVLSGLLKAKRAVTSTVCKHVCITVLFLNRLVPLGCVHMTNYCLSPAASVREGG